MKNILFTFVLLSLINKCNGQLNLQSAFNSTFSGRSITLILSKNINENNEFGAGLRFNINKLAHNDDQNNVFKKRLYVTKPIHYIGVETFYKRNIFKQWEQIKPFVFYDLQATYSTTRNRDFLPYSYDVNGDVLYKEHINFFGPFTWIEQNIGIGFKSNLFNNFYLTQKMGFGAAFILGYEKKLLGKYFNWFDWSFASLVNIGIEYRFNKKDKS